MYKVKRFSSLYQKEFKKKITDDLQSIAEDVKEINKYDEAIDKAKGFIKSNKKALIGAGILTTAAGIGTGIAMRRNKKSSRIDENK